MMYTLKIYAGQSIDVAALITSIVVIIIIACVSMPICIICLTVALICTCRKYRKSKAQGHQALDEGAEPTSLHVPQNNSAPYVHSSAITATNGITSTHGPASVRDATYEYITDSELPMEGNRAYDVRDGGIRVGENEAYGQNEVPAANFQPNEAYNYRQPVPTPNIAYGGHNTGTDHDKFTGEMYEYIN